MAKLIIVHGQVGTGKTTFALRLSKALGLPCFRKDVFMETFFDTLQHDEKEQKLYGRTSYALLFSMADELLKNNVSCILEGNLRHEFHEEPLKALIDKHHPEVIQYFLYTEPHVLEERIMQRATDAGQRHPGHKDLHHLPEVLQRDMRPLQLGGTLHSIDTTSFASDPFASLFS